MKTQCSILQSASISLTIPKGNVSPFLQLY